MYNTLGQLTLIAGLPGSGKTRWMKKNFPTADFLMIDDFMAHALHDIGRFTYSLWYFPLVFALRSGRNAVISDIAFCEDERRKEAERVMSDSVKDLVYRWHFFEHAAAICRQNIERRAREEGNTQEDAFRELNRLSPLYHIPSGFPVEPVFRP